jgi:HK97 family phage major capsid protein
MARSSTSAIARSKGRVVRAVDQAYTAGHVVQGDAARQRRGQGVVQVARRPIGKAQGEGVDSAGGFLVPEELMANIIVLRELFGVFRQECQVVPMGSDTSTGRAAPAASPPSSLARTRPSPSPRRAWDNVNLTAKKLGVLTRMSTEIDQDAVVAIADWLVGEIAYAFASKEDDCGFNGDGTSTYGGMRGLTVLAIDGNHNASASSPPRGHNSFAH